MDDSRPPEHVKPYTAILCLFGLGFLVAAVVLRGSYESLREVLAGLPGGGVPERTAWAYAALRILLVGASGTLLLVVALRTVRARIARPATAAASWFVGLLCFPLGTAALAWWWLDVRHREHG